METVSDLDVELPGIVVMEAAEGEAVVEEHAAVGDVNGLEINGEALAKLPAEPQIKGCVWLKMIPGKVLRRLSMDAMSSSLVWILPCHALSR